ncbi:DUF6152 family protein [Methylotenera versatilis]|uniref:DUF6152 family protein n=1 Tax=Methylotenera versatilis TaxID=1055487 RepID=UPI00064563E7|nr:DUF6152 family protein [Methylotenera versatilis]
MSRKTIVAGALAVLGVVVSTLPANAHHAFSAEFDAAQPIKVKGIVTKFELVNPHSWLYIDVTGPDGKVTQWGFEFGAPFGLKEKGITKKTLAVGTEITINGYKAKNDQNFGYAVESTLADGRTIKTGGAQDAPAAQPATN